MDRDQTPIANLAVSDETRRTIETSLAAGTSGAGFVVLQASLTALAVLLLISALSLAGFTAVAALRGDAGAWRIVGFSLLFAIPIGLFLAMQIPFLHALRRAR